jgi:hypothetical protein
MMFGLLLLQWSRIGGSNLPEGLINVESVNSFMNTLDKIQTNQDIRYND